jgi:hypothetical protein
LPPVSAGSERSVSEPAAYAREKSSEVSAKRAKFGIRLGSRATSFRSVST